MKKTIEVKLISIMDDDILKEIADDKIQEEMEIATLFEINTG